MAWVLFLLRSVLLVIILYMPGMVCLSKLEIPNYALIAVAPTFTVTLLSITMAIASACGAALGWQIYMLILALVLLAGLYRNNMAIMRRVVVANKTERLDPSVLYLVVSFILSMWIYVKTLNGPDSVIPLLDNANTLSMVRSMLNTNIYGPVLSSNYLDSPILNEGPSYYPGVFHSISALLAKMTSCGPSQAINIVMFVSLFALLPMSVLSLVESCFPDKKRIIYAGAFAPLAFSAFPWNLITFGPLLTNLFSLVFVPSFVSLVVLAFAAEELRVRRSLCLSIGLSGAALGFTHPGALFTAGVILVPLIVREVYGYFQSQRGAKLKPIIAAAICVAAIALAWIVCYKIPFMKSTVSFTWFAFMKPSEAISKLLTLSFADYQAQLVNVALVAAGVLWCIRRGENSTWLLYSALLSSALYITDVSMDGDLKQILGGFWYTDSRRMAVMIIIPLMPLFACGLSRLVEVCEDFVRNQRDSVVSPFVYASCVAAIVVLSVYGPSLEIPGSFTLASAISNVRGTLASLNDLRGNPKIEGHAEVTMLDEAEVNSGGDIKEIVGNSYVLNSPLDGSSFLYGLDDVRVFYRSSSAQEDDDPYAMLRQHVNEYASNREVRDLVKDLQIKYVLQLDSGVMPSARSTFDRIYDPQYWSGIQKVNGATPGFELVYAKDDIRLYRLADA